MAATVSVTESAANKIGALFVEKALPNQAGLRIQVQGGGCSGLSYHLSIDDDPDKFDRVFESNGVRLIVDKKSFLYTAGLILDFDTDDFNGGFVFHNPKAKATCGCGTSFSV
ncbi:MAG TPA: iron-sulfur cluster assembly accessory protein [Deltaproteobacteria bacterium]|nr:iron-sulfur cluster assembly accessory protein [Deltaproteobacteria bacterium]HCP44529.1 iron-sulfur cluster assembly accessory protein [Deltaproteobacteria bacterium]